VGGDYTPDNPPDALIVSYYQDDIASKGAERFRVSLRREVWAKLKHLETDGCPFVNLPEDAAPQRALTREEIKNCVCLTAASRGDRVHRLDTDGHSRFCGVRDDEDPSTWYLFSIQSSGKPLFDHFALAEPKRLRSR
jgi:hypothetical protein